MKKKNFLCLALMLMSCTVFLSFSSINKKTSQVEPTVFKIMEVTYLWELLQTDYEPNHDRDGTWLNVGFRAKYAMAKNYASLHILEKVFDEKVFLSGPHGEDFDFFSTTSFGHYNPVFLNKLYKAMDTALQNPMFKTVAQQLYRSHLRSMARTYYDAHDFMYSSPSLIKQLKKEYLEKMAMEGGTTEGSFQETFRGHANAVSVDRGADIYEAFTAPAFWLRRDMDGTGDEFIKILELVINELE